MSSTRDTLITLEEAAQYCVDQGVPLNRQTLQAYAYRGRLRATKISSVLWMTSKQDIDEYLASRHQGKKSKR